MIKVDWLAARCLLTPAAQDWSMDAGVIDTDGAPSLVNISENFRKKIEMTLMLFSAAWGKMIHEKNLKQKIL
jgi:hypothetical protein